MANLKPVFRYKVKCNSWIGSLSVEELCLDNARAKRVLHMNNIKTIGELIDNYEKIPEMVSKCKGCANGTSSNIRAALFAYLLSRNCVKERYFC